MTFVITTYDWVPPFAVGYVRDLRIRWACEEAGLPYRIETTSVREKTAQHFARQPFGQVPILRDGDLSLFESGAILLYLGERAEALMPRDAAARAETQQWLIAALNTLEPPVMAMALARIFDQDARAEELALPRLRERLAQLVPVLEGRDFIAAGRFTIADILLADVLRLVDSLGELAAYPVLAAYMNRITARPAFQRAHAAQVAHFAQAA
ncbi:MULTISPECIES: glutathione S-transferase family protein [Paracoccus]|uniref:Glutathione S-transferase n=1 Tax=Paracoccus versutus TaxID=34007 RepID=A0A3D9XH93_PARVE|nr:MULTISPECIES: glutathione S-transferase family protein [Paracoccus]REF69876.1 glutathione S-transferase [Paracoccus versutus]WGR57768.1 glutathione S-transferase family protein [Paracoccus versutus]